MNAFKPPLQKEKDPGFTTTGLGKQNDSKLPQGDLAVNPGHASKRELLRATAECLEALREFAGKLGGAK